MKKRIGIIGSGTAGLQLAYALKEDFDVTVFHHRSPEQIRTGRIMSTQVHFGATRRRENRFAMPKWDEQALVAEHDRLVLQYPLQWYSTPSLLKQWLDEVFTTTWLFGPGGSTVVGKELVLAISIGGVEDSYQAGGLIGYTISELTRPLQALTNQIGMTMLPHFKFHGAVQATDEQIESSAKQYIQHILNPELDPRIARQRMLNEMKQKMKVAQK